MNFYSPKGEKISKEDFIQMYSNGYFLDNEQVVSGVRRNSRYVEDEIELILKRGIKSKLDVIHILAWKIGHINHKDSEELKKFVYDVEWESAESKDCKVKCKGNDFDLEGIAEFIVNNISLFEERISSDYQYVFEQIADKGFKQLGKKVYVITLLYFISKGKYPIYDRYAAKALYTIKNEISPGTPVRRPKLPDGNLKVVKSVYGYIEDLKEIFGDEYQTNRDIDRALWVYGQAFPDEKK